MLSIKNLAKKRLPPSQAGIPNGVLFSTITDRVLGPDYDLSLVLCDNVLSHELNRVHRHKDYPTNVLSFPLSNDVGEIFINLSKAATECALFDRKLADHVVALFIHGALHLKGLTHGSTMERIESKLVKEFSQSPNVQSDRHRSRYRNGNNSSGRLRVQKRK